MRSDTLLAALPDLSARIMRDALVNDYRISWERFCNHHQIRALNRNGAELLAEEELHLQAAFAEATGHEPDLWFGMGLRYRSMKYGAIGLAMMTARTLADALRVACRFQELTYSLITYRLEVAPNGSMALIGEGAGVPADLLNFSLYRDLGAIRTLIADLTGGVLPLEKVAVAAPPAPGFEGVRKQIPCPVEFGAARTQWQFLPGTAGMLLPLADGELMTLYSTKCEGLLKNARASAPLSQRLSALLDISPDRAPCAGEIAERFALSERTLHRRLSEEGTRFSALVDKARYRRACQLLADRTMSVEAIAFTMGFAEPSSFSRAFKRWSGMGSLEYRRKLQAGGTGLN